MSFFCVSTEKNKFYLYSTSKYILIPVQSNHPNIIQYYILPEKNKHISLFYVSLSSIAHHNLNHNLNKKANRNIPVISKPFLNCNQIIIFIFIIIYYLY